MLKIRSQPNIHVCIFGTTVQILRLAEKSRITNILKQARTIKFAFELLYRNFVQPNSLNTAHS